MQVIRKAKLNDSKDIYALINSWAKKQRVLERSLNDIYENIRDFWVCESRGRVIACCALHVVGWQKLGEIRSLIVHRRHQGKNIGKQLIKKALVEAKSLGLTEVFALTFVPGFFKKLKFRNIPKTKLPHKIWSDCVNCVCFPDCTEEAVIITV